MEDESINWYVMVVNCKLTSIYLGYLHFIRLSSLYASGSNDLTLSQPFPWPSIVFYSPSPKLAFPVLSPKFVIRGPWNIFFLSLTLSQKCPNTEFFLGRMFLYLIRIQENTDQKKLRIWTLFRQCNQF